MTGQRGPIWPLKKVVSANFSKLDTLKNGTGEINVGRAAAHCLRVWGPVRTKESRWRDSTILGSAMQLNGGIFDLKRGDSLTMLSTAIVPTTAQSHSFLEADWGYWACDSGSVEMTSRRLACLGTFEDLRRRGMSEKEPFEPVPRVDSHERLGLTFVELLSAWADISVLQQTPLLIHMANKLTRKPKTAVDKPRKEESNENKLF